MLEAQPILAMTITETINSSAATAAATNGEPSSPDGTSDDKAVTAIPPAIANTKHPLQYSWTLWYYKNDRTKTWQDNLREVVTFSTVEDFWAVYNHIELASRLVAGSDYSVFKKGVKPMWEDEQNKNGGRWLLNLDKKMRMSTLDDAWLEILLCLIGESFGDDDCNGIVNGAVVSIRNKGDKIGVWLGDAKVLINYFNF